MQQYENLFLSVSFKSLCNKRVAANTLVHFISCWYYNLFDIENQLFNIIHFELLLGQSILTIPIKKRGLKFFLPVCAPPPFPTKLFLTQSLCRKNKWKIDPGITLCYH